MDDDAPDEPAATVAARWLELLRLALQVLLLAAALLGAATRF